VNLCLNLFLLSGVYIDVAHEQEPGVGTVEPPVHDALHEAFVRHYERLLRFCYLLVGRREVAEDLAQESFVRVAARIGTVPQAQLASYLRRTALNLWKNRLRRLAKERRLAAREPVPLAPGVPPEDRHDLWSVLLALPRRQRACVVLRFYEDLPEKEVAQILGCSVGTVKSQVSRGLRMMRKELEE
jgi:RNA polymerase sigma-70 factor (sigma-E family)